MGTDYFSLMWIYNKYTKRTLCYTNYNRCMIDIMCLNNKITHRQDIRQFHIAVQFSSIIWYHQSHPFRINYHHPWEQARWSFHCQQCSCQNIHHPDRRRWMANCRSRTTFAIWQGRGCEELLVEKERASLSIWYASVVFEKEATVTLRSSTIVVDWTWNLIIKFKSARQKKWQDINICLSRS